MVPQGWSLEEFTSRRNVGNRNSAGRGDLWIGFGERKVFTIEAKIVWPAGGGVEETVKMVRREMGKASEQLKNLDKGYREGIATTVCYVVPELLQSSSSENPQILKNYFTKVPQSISKGKAFVGSFHYESSCPAYEKKLYPGVMVIVEFLKWR